MMKNFSKKMDYATQFIAKEVPSYFLLLNDNYKSISRPMNEKCTNVQIKPRVKKKSFGLKITGFDKTGNGVLISDIGCNGSAYYDSERKLEVGQYIKKINGESLAGKTYSEIVEAIRRTKDTYKVDLFVTDVYPESKKKIFLLYSQIRLRRPLVHSSSEFAEMFGKTNKRADSRTY